MFIKGNVSKFHTNPSSGSSADIHGQREMMKLTVVFR